MGLLQRKSISDALWNKLKEIPAPLAPYSTVNYHPADVRMKDGRVEKCVVFFDRSTFGRNMGYNPKSTLELQWVDDVFASPYQLPPVFANELYSGGESRMGGIDFSLTMKDNLVFHYTLGVPIVDFIYYPAGYQAADISKATWGRDPGRSREDKEALGGPPFFWCFYDESREALRRIRHEATIDGMSG